MLLNHSGSKKAEWSRTDSGISYQLSKSKASLSSRVASKQLDEYRENTSGCQHSKQEIFMISTNGLRVVVSSLYRTRCSELDSRSAQKSCCHRFFVSAYFGLPGYNQRKMKLGRVANRRESGKLRGLRNCRIKELRWLVFVERG